MSERIPYVKQSADWDGETAAVYRDPASGKYIVVEPQGDGTYGLGYSMSAEFDENQMMLKRGLTLENAKQILAGIADGSLEIGEKGIFKRTVAEAPEAPVAPEAPEKAKAPEKKKAPDGDKVSSDEGKKSDGEKNKGETEKKAKFEKKDSTEKKPSRKKKKAAKKAEAKRKADGKSKVRYSIATDINGEKYVNVDSDTEIRHSAKEIVKTLSEIVRTKFNSFVEVNGQKIGIKVKTAREWVYSKNAVQLKNSDNVAFEDKIKSFKTLPAPTDGNWSESPTNTK